MGQAYCQSCCGVKNNQVSFTISDLKTFQGDAPGPKFAKSVKQFIEVHPKIKQIYVRERAPHISERKAVKLNLYYLFAYAAYYDGEWKNGLPHGSGRLIYDDGSIYEGCFKDGFAECRNALFIKQNGTFYKGEVKMNKAQGDGLLSNEKITYRGQWHNDLPHGEGQQLYSRISYYVGSFQNGKKQGFGNYQWNQVEHYQGQFKQNVIHGYGKHFTKQFVYEGYFQNGEKNGQGKLKNLFKKWEYEGQFKNNKMHGKGTYKWDDGTIFEGEFEENEKKKGKLITKDGQMIEQF